MNSSAAFDGIVIYDPAEIPPANIAVAANLCNLGVIPIPTPDDIFLVLFIHGIQKQTVSNVNVNAIMVVMRVGL
jgi:hypothetical protein